VTYDSYESLEGAFAEKKLHPMDLKNAMADRLVEILRPAMKHFSTPKMKKAREEMEKLIITR
jgi:tyrosyl-tRNA synthetase